MKSMSISVGLFIGAVAGAALAQGPEPSPACHAPTTPGEVQAVFQPDPSACGTVQVLGEGTGTVCQWRFGYRDGIARARLAAIGAYVRDCTGTAPMISDEVNHPDSFIQHEFDTPAGRLSISVKDKSAQRATYLFVRWSPDP